MSEYLIMDLIIFSGPFLASFDSNLRFIRYWRIALVSITLIGAVYIAWDIWATSRGHWQFNPEYVASFRFFGLPIEEILFFMVVPYAGLFIWKTIQFYRKDKDDHLPFVPLRSSVLLAGVGGAMWIGKGYEYTALAAWSGALFFAADHFLKTHLTNTVTYWLTQCMMVLATLVFNGFLTARPVVLYGEAFQLGLRIYTIPVEDFLYGFGLMSWVMLVFVVLTKDKGK
jgi:lycopene cyclase domain-containing protein